MPRYLHDLPDWPALRWDDARLAGTLAGVRHRQGRLIGRMEALGFPLQQEAALAALTEETVKSSDIEGEQLDAQQVRSSLARRLGFDAAGVDVVDRRAEGVADMMLDATRNHEQPLTPDRLFGWHTALFPGGRSGMRKIRVGAWRAADTDPMQVVSGPFGRKRVHFEAPPAHRLTGEMDAFLRWFNAGEGPPVDDGVLKAALAHLWFVTIHPFDDGNGRMARAITELALARSERTAQRFYSMSAQIRRERSDYYDILERTQQGALDVTDWIEWFLRCLDRTIAGAHTTLAAVLRKARFWEQLRDIPLNERQRRLLNRLLDGFEGKLTTSKWAKIAKCSPDTALRDILALVDRGVLVRNPGAGRSTSYSLAAGSQLTNLSGLKPRPPAR